MPAAKLMPPSTSMKIRKPVGPSERCGVSSAEKIVGSELRSLSEVIRLTIGERWRAKNLGKLRNPQLCARRAPARPPPSKGLKNAQPPTRRRPTERLHSG